MTDEMRKTITNKAFGLLEESPARTFEDVRLLLVAEFGAGIQNDPWFFGEGDSISLYRLVLRRAQDIAGLRRHGWTQDEIDDVRRSYVPQDFRGVLSRSRATVRVIGRVARGRAPRRRTSRARPTLALAHASPARPGRQDDDPELPPLVRRIWRALVRPFGRARP